MLMAKNYIDNLSEEARKGMQEKAEQGIWPIGARLAISTSRVNSLKGVSSRRMRQMHPTLRPRYHKGVLWSPSYFAASCGGAPISIIRQYIERQRNPQSASYRAKAPRRISPA